MLKNRIFWLLAIVAVLAILAVVAPLASSRSVKGASIVDNSGDGQLAVTMVVPTRAPSYLDVLPNGTYVTVTQQPSGLNKVGYGNIQITLNRRATFVSSTGVKTQLSDWAAKNGGTVNGYWYRDSAGNVFIFETLAGYQKAVK